MSLRQLDNSSPKFWRLFGLLIFFFVCRLVAVAGVPKPSPPLPPLPLDVEEEYLGRGGGGGGGGLPVPFPVKPDEHGLDFQEIREREHRSGNRLQEKNKDGQGLEEGKHPPPPPPTAEDQGTGVDVSDIGDPLGTQAPLRVAPQYMLELYKKFSKDKYSHPIANIVRSFKNVNTGAPPVWTNGNNTRIALHTLLFNISSINSDEEIYLAELRLYTSKKTQRILVYEVVVNPPPPPPPPSATHPDADDEGHAPPPPPPPRPLRYHLLTSREIAAGGRGNWETFSVTDVVRRWVRTQATAGHILEVRVDTAAAAATRASNGPPPPPPPPPEVTEGGGGGAKVKVVLDEVGTYEPILVVFSNDRKRRKIELRELHEIQKHENELREEEEEDEDEDEEEEEAMRIKNHYLPPSQSHLSTSFPSSLDEEDEEAGNEEEEDEEDEEEEDEDYDVGTEASSSPPGKYLPRTQVNSTNGSPSSHSRVLPRSVSASKNEGEARRPTRVKRTALNRGRHRRGKRNSCRRKPMYVDFRDIKWEHWIIQPPGYQAYECTGQCYFPLGERLTPTKYAMVKSLLHATYPKRASAVCCVPTRLEPISMLYLDEQSTLTYKYNYDGMVVAECGCR